MTDTLERLSYGWSKPVVARQAGQTSEHWWPPKSQTTACGRYRLKAFVFMETPRTGIGNHPCGRCFNAWKRWARREALA